MEGKVSSFLFHICPQVILGHHHSDEKTRVQHQGVCFSLVSGAGPEPRRLTHVNTAEAIPEGVGCALDAAFELACGWCQDSNPV